MFRKRLCFLWYSVSYKPLRKLPDVIAKAIFLFFVLMPWYTKKDKTKPMPERVTG